MLTTCAVTPDGRHVMLSMRDENGADHTLLLSAHQAASLTMTLPGLLTQSLRKEHRDNSLRYVFPLDRFGLEWTTACTFILTLEAPQGFAVSFGATRQEFHSLNKLIGATLEEGHGAQLLQ